MKTVLRYAANDGSEWTNEHDAKARDTLIAECEAVNAILGPRPNLPDGSFVEHDQDAVQAFSVALAKLARRHTAWFDGWSKVPDSTLPHPFSIVGRIINDSKITPLDRLWWRYQTLYRNREYQQPYYAIQAEKAGT